MGFYGWAVFWPVGLNRTPSKKLTAMYITSRCWFQIFFILTPNLGEDFQFDEHVFQMGGSTTNQT